MSTGSLAGAGSPKMGCIEQIGSGEDPDQIMCMGIRGWRCVYIPRDEESEDEVEDGANEIHAHFHRLLDTCACNAYCMYKSYFEQRSPSGSRDDNGLESK